MSGNHIRHITTVAVGTPPPAYTREERVEVDVHGFLDLPSVKDEMIEFPEFTCFGRQWHLEIYPGGEENAEDGMVSIFLAHCSRGSIELAFVLIAKNSAGKEIEHWFPASDDTTCFGPYGGKDATANGDVDFVKRSEIADCLVDGTLVIEVRMKLIEATDTPVPPFVPENPLCKNILKIFMDEKSADVLFEVGNKTADCAKRTPKKTKRSPTTFPAHHLILQNSAQPLAELCSSGILAPVQISDVKPEIFHHMLYYIYGGKISDEDLKASAKDIIHACDKYGVVNLKLEAEACYAKSVTFTAENVVDNLLYADSKNCALLREVVMDYLMENAAGILGKVSFANVPGSVVSDLLTATARGKQIDDDGNSDNYRTMRVSTLRKKLHQKGFEVDGSREAMIALLQGNS